MGEQPVVLGVIVTDILKPHTCVKCFRGNIFSHEGNEDEHKSLKEVALFKDKTARHNPCRQPIS